MLGIFIDLTYQSVGYTLQSVWWGKLSKMQKQLPSLTMTWPVCNRHPPFLQSQEDKWVAAQLLDQSRSTSIVLFQSAKAKNQMRSDEKNTARTITHSRLIQHCEQVVIINASWTMFFIILNNVSQIYRKTWSGDSTHTRKWLSKQDNWSSSSSVWSCNMIQVLGSEASNS